MRIIKKCASLFFMAMICTELLASVVNVRGCIKDKKSKEPLIGATVQIIGSNIGAVTDLNGNFKLTDIKDGVYDIQIKYVGYKTVISKKVRIINNEVITLDLEMDSDEKKLGDVVVVAKANRESENTALLEQRQSLLAVQSVTSKELSRKGVGDAQDAVTKVSGISKQEGVKNVFVRGLGDRYNYTTLNGLPLPSEDPEYKNIALDFFSTDIIQTVGVSKSFNANKAGDVTGAVIDITSKELNTDKDFNINISGGVNTQILGNDFYKADGTNSFGFANTSRPSKNGNFDFSNKMTPTKYDLPYNKGLNITAGRKFNLGDNSLSLFAVGGYNDSFSYCDESIKKYLTNNLETRNQNAKKSSESTNHIGMLNMEYNIGSKYSIYYNLMYIHTNTQYVSFLDGFNADYTDRGSKEGYGNMLRQQTKDNSLFVNQLLTKWKLNDRLNLNINGSYNTVKGNEPDRRINLIVKNEDDNYVFARGENIQQRYYSTLDKDDINAETSLNYIFSKDSEKKSNITLGYKGRFIKDNFDATNYRIIPSSEMIKEILNPNNVFGNLDNFFSKNTIENSFTLTPGTSIYNVKTQINSGFADLVYYITPRFIANAGVRVDQINMKLNWFLNDNTNNGNKSIDKQYILPSLNLKYDLNKKNSLRLTASKTYTLPQAKEWSPFKYLDINFSSQGNSSLKPSENYNLDLKWDFSPSSSELISITGFYKHIIDPIARVDVGNAAGTLSYDNVSDKAMVLGSEIEIRKNIFATPASMGKSHKLTAGLNAAYTYTNLKSNLNQAIEGVTGTQLEGAAPFIMNCDLSYNYSKEKLALTNTLVFNYISDRIYSTGLAGYYDVIEKGIPTLDFVSQTNINSHLSISLKAKNLLNSSYKLTQDVKINNKKITNTINEYKKGIDLSLGITYKF